MPAPIPGGEGLGKLQVNFNRSVLNKDVMSFCETPTIPLNQPFNSVNLSRNRIHCLLDFTYMEVGGQTVLKKNFITSLFTGIKYSNIINNNIIICKKEAQQHVV